MFTRKPILALAGVLALVLTGCGTVQKAQEKAEDVYAKPGKAYCKEVDETAQANLRARSDAITEPEGFRYRVECIRG